MSEWYPQPKYPEGQAGIASLAPQQEQAPEVPMPNEGDTLKLIVSHWGGVEILTPATHIRPESKVIEATVNAVKTAKVVLE